MRVVLFLILNLAFTSFAQQKGLEVYFLKTQLLEQFNSYSDGFDEYENGDVEFKNDWGIKAAYKTEISSAWKLFLKPSFTARKHTYNIPLYNVFTRNNASYTFNYFQFIYKIGISKQLQIIPEKLSLEVGLNLGMRSYFKNADFDIYGRYSEFANGNLENYNNGDVAAFYENDMKEYNGTLKVDADLIFNYALTKSLSLLAGLNFEPKQSMQYNLYVYSVHESYSQITGTSQLKAYYESFENVNYSYKNFQFQLGLAIALGK